MEFGNLPIVRIVKRLSEAVGYLELGMTQPAMASLDDLRELGPFAPVAEMLRAEAARQAVAAAEEIGEEGARAGALCGVAQALAQAGEVDGLRRALAAAEGIGDEGPRAEALSGVAQALAQIEQPNRALAVCLKAFRAARSGGRDTVFLVLGQAAPTLAGIEHGQVLRQVYDQVMEVMSWWDA